MSQLTSLVQSRWGRYGFSVAATGVVSLLYFLFAGPEMGSDLRYFCFTLAVVSSALLGGLGPGLLATGLAALTSAYFLLPPIFSVQVDSAERMARLIVFFGEGVLLSCVSHVVRRGVRDEISGIQRYIPAAVFVCAATGLKLMLFSDVAREIPFTYFYAATAASALLGGVGPGLTATLLSSLSARYFFFEPQHSLSVSSPTDAIRIILFLAEGIFLSWLSAKHVTARRFTSEALTRTREYLQQMWHSVEDAHALRQISRDFIWEWDLKTDQVGGGVPQVENPGRGDTMRFLLWLQQIHPDDRASVFAILASALQEGRNECFCQYRRKGPAGTYVSVSDHAYIIRDASWAPIRVIGRSAEITDMLRTVLVDEQVPHRAAFERNPLAILLTDDVLHVVATNNEACRVLGYPHAELTKMYVGELFEKQKRRRLGEILLGLGRQSGSSISIEEVIVRANGASFPARITACRISGMNDNTADRMIVIEEISEGNGFQD